MMSFRTLVVDPPWDMHGDLAKGSRPERHHYIETGVGEKLTYPRMSVEQIKRIPLEDAAADDAHLYLWVTNAALVHPRHGWTSIGNAIDGLDVTDALTRLRSPA